jgi:predicted O-methyltransferase YrrM
LDVAATSDDVRAFAKSNWDEFAQIVGEALGEKVAFDWGRDPGYKRHFRAWQQAGFSVVPNHFYGPIPDLNTITEQALTAPLPLHGIDLRAQDQLALLSKLSAYKAEYSAFVTRPPETRGKFRFGGAFARVDAEVLYAMVRHFKPKRIIEIGSGFSTFAMAEACAANAAEGAAVNFVSVDPYASWVADEKPEGLTQHIREPIEAFDQSFFAGLESGDILFIDSSHIWRPGNDVEHEYFRILPLLPSGTLVHIHDVFLPYPYPPSWAQNEHVFWNEQIILAAFLAFNRDFQVELAGHYLAREHYAALAAAIPGITPDVVPGSFWMRRS